MGNHDSARTWKYNNNIFVNENAILVCQSRHIVLESFKTVIWCTIEIICVGHFWERRK